MGRRDEDVEIVMNHGEHVGDRNYQGVGGEDDNEAPKRASSDLNQEGEAEEEDEETVARKQAERCDSGLHSLVYDSLNDDSRRSSSEFMLSVLLSSRRWSRVCFLDISVGTRCIVYTDPILCFVHVA